MMANVGIIGAGSWGIAIALLLNKNGHNVTIWSVLEDEIRMIQEEREHKKCLPGVKIPEEITVTNDVESTVKNSDMLVLAVASPFTRSTAKIIAPYVKDGQIIINVGKGIEESTLMTLCQVVEDEIPQANVTVL